MTAQTQTRKWTATVSVAGVDVTDLIEPTRSATSDTLAAVRADALAVARRMIAAELGTDASVIISKQLANDDAPVRDRSYYVFRDLPTRRFPDGIVVDYCGA